MATDLLTQMSYLPFQSSEVCHGSLNSICRQGCAPSGPAGGKFISLPFLAPSSLPHSLVQDLFLHLQSQQRRSSPYDRHTPPTLLPSSLLLPLSLTLQDAWGHLGPIQIIANNLLILRSADRNLNSTCNLNSPSPCKLTIHRFVGIRTLTFGEDVWEWGGGGGGGSVLRTTQVFLRLFLKPPHP